MHVQEASGTDSSGAFTLTHSSFHELMCLTVDQCICKDLGPHTHFTSVTHLPASHSQSFNTMRCDGLAAKGKPCKGGGLVPGVATSKA